MVRHLVTSPTASPASISSDYSLSSVGYNLALAALTTIFTMAITALIKYVVVQIIHGWDQLFRRPAAAPVAPGPVALVAVELVAPVASEVVDPATSTPLAPGVVDLAAAAPLTPGPVAPAGPEVVDQEAAAQMAHGPVTLVGLEPVASAAPGLVDHAAPQSATQAAGLEEIVQQSH